MEQLAANEARFAFAVADLDSELSVIGFDGAEGVSRLFEIELELACENLDLPFDSIMGSPATLCVMGRAGQRFINGIISRFELSGQARRFACYRATLVPYLWFFRHRRGSRIFQDLSIDQVIGQILREGGVPADDFRFVLRGNHPVRDYCVQYRESELDFMCRLMEEEGIFFYFEHCEERHILVMADSRTVHLPVAVPSLIPYRADTNTIAYEEYIRSLRYIQEIKPGRVTLRGFDFRKPQRNLEVKADAEDETACNEIDLEVYDYPGEYEIERESQLFAEVRLQEHRTPGITITGESDCKRFVPGYLFEVEYHPRGDINRDYLITHLHHSAKQPQVLEESAGLGQASYSNRFDAVPADADYRPPRVTHRPVVEGSQTAFVVGPAGEEIYVDKYGRVKVQFHWDREGQRDQHSSCWIRVSQTIAGAGWGSMFIPRIGQEVIVDFLEGDPDQPIIVGRVYNGQSMPPYGLPAQGVVSGVKSNTVKGRGYNEISFNDTAGREHFTMHAQFDMSAAVGHDRKEKVGNDQWVDIASNRTDRVGVDASETIGANLNQSVGGSRNELVWGNADLVVLGDQSIDVVGHETEIIGGNTSITVGADRAEHVFGNESVTVGGNRTEIVSLNKDVRIDSSYSVEVAAEMVTTVHQNHRENISISKYTLVEKNIFISAGAALVIDVGKSTLAMKKDGKIEINGTDLTFATAAGRIHIDASGVITIKGSQVRIGGALVTIDGSLVKINT